MKKSLEIRRLDIYDAVGVYTIQFLDKAETEFMDFMSKHYCPVKAGKSVFEIVET